MQKVEKIDIGDEGFYKVLTDKGSFYCNNFVDYDNIVSFGYYKVLSIEKIF